MKPPRLTSAAGFGIVDLLIAFAVVTGFMALFIGFVNSQNMLSEQNRTSATFDRIVSGVRSLAGNPAALRNSMRAVTGGTTFVNPALAACAGGTPLNGCVGQTDSPFTLYAPFITNGPSGPVISPVTSPSGSSSPMHFDTWGSPCATPGPSCALIVFTTMRAQCAPPPQDASLTAPGSLTAAMLTPQANCTIANVIEITYTIQVDSTVNPDPALSVFLSPVTGTIATPVVLISGNQPQ